MMDEYMKYLIDSLTREIAKRRVSVTVFADLCGVSRNEMSKILNGRKKDICLSTLMTIAYALDKPFYSLVMPGEIQKIQENQQSDRNAKFIERMYSEIKQHMRKINAA